MDRPLFEIAAPHAAVRRRNWFVAGSALALMGLGVVLTVLGAADAEAMFAIGMILTSLGVVASILAFVADPLPIWERGLVQVFANAIRFGERTIPRSSLGAGYVQPLFDAAPKVSLLDRRGREALVLHVQSTEQARALLDTLGLDPMRSTVTYRVASKLSYGTGAGKWATLSGALAVAASAGAIALLDAWGILVAIPILLAFTIAMFTKARVTVGADGVLIRWFGTRFLPASIIQGAQACAEGVAITLHGGQRVVLATYTGRGHDYLGGAIIERIREVLRALATLGGEADVLAVPGLSELPPAERVRALRALTKEGGGGYRRVVIPPERLLRVVEDVTADAPARASAAIALAPALDEEGKARLRRIAEGCASPNVRIAIEAAASGADEAALAEALESCATESRVR